ncbi:MAG: transposase [Bacillota bacterium]|nr:transposase [Bacillota bacterium]
MPETFITIEQAAELEGISYNTFIVRKNRNPELYKTKTEQSEAGGKERILVDLASLSKKAMRTYQMKQEIQVNLIKEFESSDGDDDEAWYVGVELSKYMAKHNEQFYKNVEFANRIKEYLDYRGFDKTQYTEQFAERLGMSGRNFRRKVDKYLEGCAWAIEMNEHSGKNYDFYKILALCPRPREKKYIALTDEMKVLIENIWFNPSFAANHRKQTQLYIVFCKIAETKGWVLLPSYPTVNRYINEISGKYAGERFLADQGMRELKRKMMIKRRRNTGMLKVMELVQGDAHTFDCWVKVIRPNGHITAIKPYLAALIDTRSRCLVGWAVCEVPCSDVIKQMLMHMMYPKKNNPIEGVPRIILIDNGKDWTAQTLTGRNRKERVSLDGEIKGFFKSIGIEDDMRSLPYQAWTKAQIERFFGTLCYNFTNEFDSYTGTLTGSKTIGKIKKDIKGMLERNELLSIEEFATLFDNWLNVVYHNRVHSGLKEQKEKDPRPLSVFQDADRYFKAAPPMEYTRVLLMKAEERMVYATGIKMDNGYYHNEALGRYIGKKVDIRFSQDNPSILHVYDKDDGSKLCEAYLEKGLNPLAAQNDPELAEHMQVQHRQLRGIRENLLYLQTSYENRQLPRKASKADRKVILPELKEEAPKIVSMVDDKQYKEEVKKRKGKGSADCNEFFDRQFEKAMAKLG